MENNLPKEWEVKKLVDAFIRPKKPIESPPGAVFDPPRRPVFGVSEIPEVFHSPDQLTRGEGVEPGTDLRLPGF